MPKLPTSTHSGNVRTMVLRVPSVPEEDYIVLNFEICDSCSKMLSDVHEVVGILLDSEYTTHDEAVAALHRVLEFRKELMHRS